MVKLSNELILTLLLLAITIITYVKAVDHGGHCCEDGGRDEYNCYRWCIYDQQEQDFCYAKYIPGGDKIILEPIEAPTATLKGKVNINPFTPLLFLKNLKILN